MSFKVGSWKMRQGWKLSPEGFRLSPQGFRV
jgi:hypothetical protein